MRVVVVAEPSPIVSFAEAARSLRLGDDVTEQPYVELLIAAATAHIDGPSGWLGRAIGVQTLEWRGEEWDCGISLPYPPVISVTSVKYLDVNGVLQTLAADRYAVRGASIAAAFNVSWPSRRPEPENVRVIYQAGYPTLPAPIKAAVLLMIGDLYRNRGEALINQTSVKVAMSTSVEALLQPYRVYA